MKIDNPLGNMATWPTSAHIARWAGDSPKGRCRSLRIVDRKIREAENPRMTTCGHRECSEIAHIVGIFNYLTRLADGMGLQLDPGTLEAAETGIALKRAEG